MTTLPGTRPRPAPRPKPAVPSIALPAAAPPRAAKRTGDDWPHTTRVLPWMVAGFMAVLWLVPFNTVMLAAGGPIDLQLDRLVLPVIGFVWLLATAAGGKTGPKVRLSPIHLAVGVFVAVGFLSVVVNAAELTQIGELGLSAKKLFLLVAFAGWFVMVASIVRATEVLPFLYFMLALAVLCALGTVWEFRSDYNLFYDWTDKLLPPVFTVPALASSGLDEIGRPLTRGPTDHGLEVATILSMALPIAIIGLMQAKRWLWRIVFALAAVLVVAAAVSTYRKTAFVAPAAAVLVMAAYRPRQVIKLAPLGLVVMVAVQFASPGALSGIVAQLSGDRLEEASTVNDRKSDYDAVRPDVLLHPVLGRGYGSYADLKYRVLDSELLHRVIETGFVGLASFLAVGLTVILSVRGPILGRHPLRGPPALAAAAAAAAFLMSSALFDTMSFPHVPYVFLTFAGLAAVASRTPEDG